ncbi:hypothetical protein NON20_03660 [Synechocystis sp. B12]|nr:hypothetical protein NON20_03660 [Synechocystis sp. B12]
MEACRDRPEKTRIQQGLVPVILSSLIIGGFGDGGYPLPLAIAVDPR